MSGALVEKPQVLHALPGRIRVHLPGWSGAGEHHLEQRLRRVPGVRRVAANPLTGNVLIQFGPGGADETSLVAVLGEAGRDAAEGPRAVPALPVVDEPEHGSIRRARIAVPGLDRDPRVARKVLERLRRFFGVRARAS